MNLKTSQLYLIMQIRVNNITISAEVCNIGGTTRICNATLLLNGIEEKTQEIILSPGQISKINYTVKKDNIGIYAVELDNLAGNFEITEYTEEEI